MMFLKTSGPHERPRLHSAGLGVFSGMQGFTTDAPEEVNQPFKDFKSLVSKAEIHRNPMGGNKVK